jgi:hypothetical protein
MVDRQAVLAKRLATSVLIAIMEGYSMLTWIKSGRLEAREGLLVIKGPAEVAVVAPYAFAEFIV